MNTTVNQDRLRVTPKWNAIKLKFKEETNGSLAYGSNFEIGGELDTMVEDFLHDMAKLTQAFGFQAIVEGVKLDLWKERIWTVVEKAGLLPNIAWKDELEDEMVENDNWYEINGEEDFEPSALDIKEVETTFNL